MWTAPPLWPGETAFVICGGPSVSSQNLELLRGRKVVVINSSMYSVPWADALVFGDSRWWRANRSDIEKFQGLIVSVAPSADHHNIKKLRKAAPPGLTEDRTHLTMRRTSLQATLNLLYHFEVRNIVLVGADNKADKNGRTHHHKPHLWASRPTCWEEQRAELATAQKPLKKKGIEVYNASPGSALPFWPVMSLEEAIAKCDVRDTGLAELQEGVFSGGPEAVRI